MIDLEPFLPIVLPIAIGAAIGYVTNVLAIKMLFRPLRPVLAFGRKLPFTPGILPRNRAKLAASLGNAVATELLSEEVVRGRLRDPEFRRGGARRRGCRRPGPLQDQLKGRA